MEPLTLDQIGQMLADSRHKRNSYRESLEQILGRPLTPRERNNMTAHGYIKPSKPSRRERLATIMVRRYNVPESLIEALIDEVNPDEWD